MLPRASKPAAARSQTQRGALIGGRAAGWVGATRAEWGTLATSGSVGAGLAWPRFQIDAAYDSSDTYKVGSISMVTRF
jgi:hypothetical protein